MTNRPQYEARHAERDGFRVGAHAVTAGTQTMTEHTGTAREVPHRLDRRDVSLPVVLVLGFRNASRTSGRSCEHPDKRGDGRDGNHDYEDTFHGSVTLIESPLRH